MKTICFVTRCHPKRPNMRKICVESVQKQSCDDYQHLLFHDDKTDDGYGRVTADMGIRKAKPLKGKYIMVLDDDDALLDDDFVADFKELVAKDKPDVVIFKGLIGWLGVMPSGGCWGVPPQPGYIGSFCFAVSKAFWDKYIESWGDSLGDYEFIAKCYGEADKVVWMDRLVAATQRISGGKGE